MFNAQKIPVTVITGFLGAGKTSLIRHLLENSRGKRLALVINEFGDLGVDGDILKGCGDETCREEDVVELTNGCICCTVADDFIPTLEKLLGRDDPPDHIVIETSGLALPKPLIQAFQWPEIRSRTTVDGVLTVVDGPAVVAGQFAPDPQAVQAQREADDALDHDSPLEEVFEDQLACADMVVISKIDLLDETGLARVHENVRSQTRAGVEIVSASHGALDPSVILGLGSAVEDDLDARPSHHDGLEEHDHDDFESIVVELNAVGDLNPFIKKIRAVLDVEGVLRVKGVVAVDGKSARVVVQGVGGRLDHYFDRPWVQDEAQVTKLVIIGLSGFDRGAIDACLKT